MNMSVLSSPLLFSCQFGMDCYSFAVVSCRVKVSSKTRSRKCSSNAPGDRLSSYSDFIMNSLVTSPVLLLTLIICKAPDH